MVIYEDRTLKDLRSLAKNKGIKGYSLCPTKKDLISLIKDGTKCQIKKKYIERKSPKKKSIIKGKTSVVTEVDTRLHVSKCTKRNPEPPCQEGYFTKYNPKGELCCYKSPKKKIITPNTVIQDIPKKIITPTTVIKDIPKNNDIFFSNISCDNFKNFYEKYMSNILGEGIYGKVYEYCIPKNAKNNGSEFDCDYALKIINNASEKEFKNELQISKIAGDNRIGPKIYKGILCNNTVMIFMDKLEGIEFSKYIDETLPVNLNEVKKVTEKIFKKIKDLHKLGYAHLDTHGGNIWVNKDKSVYLLDYGNSEPSTHKKIKNYDYKIFENVVIKNYLTKFIQMYKNKPKELSNFLDYKKYVMKMSQEYIKL